jgi:SAM-dependent methyltransferase
VAGFYASVARYYDAENTDKNDDIPFYLEVAQETDGPIVDVGSGTGRVMFPLARAGYDVHGIDNEPAMLDRARSLLDEEPGLRSKLHFHLGDAKTYQMPVKFGLTLVPYNGLMHFLDQDSQIAVLRNLRSWTRDDGALVLDLPNAGDVYATEDTDSIIFERTFMEPETGHLVMQQSVSTLDRTMQLLDVTWIYDEVGADGSLKRTFAPLRLYYYFYSEIRLLLALTGWEIETVFGDLDGSDFEDGAPRMVVVARPK